MNKCLLTLPMVLLTSLLSAQHANVLISNNNAPNEPSICINPKNTSQLVAAANLDNVYYSHDAGLSWTKAPVASPWGIWGDPCIGVDTAGAFYYLHLSNPPVGTGSWIDRIIIQKSVTAGTSWTGGTFTGKNGEKAQDKHWLAIDPGTNNLYVTWTQFDAYGSTNPADSSIILFSKSTDGGNSWSPAKRISQLAGDCLDSDNTAEGAVPCTGPNGEVYVIWSNQDQLWFDRSLDGGLTWLAEDIPVAAQPGGWDYAIPGIYRANGLPVTACDHSGGPYQGTIYVNWSDQRNGSDDTDIWLAKSTDGGATWSAARRVNDDLPGRQQFFTWMSLDQTTGYLWFTFYDRRSYADLRTDLYMAVSKDGGETFQNFQVSESPFIPSENVFFGDYTNVTAANNVVRPIWTRLDNNALSIWTALIDVNATTAVHPEAASPVAILDSPMPNPFTNETAVSFKLHDRALVSLQLYDLQGKKVATVFDREWRGYGKYVEKIDAVRLGLSPGAYLAILTVDGVVAKQVMVKQ